MVTESSYCAAAALARSSAKFAARALLDAIWKSAASAVTAEPRRIVWADVSPSPSSAAGPSVEPTAEARHRRPLPLPRQTSGSLPGLVHYRPRAGGTSSPAVWRVRPSSSTTSSATSSSPSSQRSVSGVYDGPTVSARTSSDGLCGWLVHSAGRDFIRGTTLVDFVGVHGELSNGMSLSGVVKPLRFNPARVAGFRLCPGHADALS